MPAIIKTTSERVLVEVTDNLSAGIWQTMKDAGHTANADGKILSIDVRHCRRGECGGIGSILMVQKQLQQVELSGCHGPFVTCFEAYGVCARCSQQAGLAPNCPKLSSALTSPYIPASSRG